MDFSRVAGVVRCKISGQGLERFINICIYNEISLWDIQAEAESYTFNIALQDFKKLKGIVKKLHLRLRILERHGLAFVIWRQKKRRVFFISLLAAFIGLYILSLFVWDIKISGNRYYTKDTLVDFLASEGVHCGMLKTGVDADALEENLRIQYPFISWVSVHVSGTRVMVLVEEGTLPLVQEENQVPGDITAAFDGEITKIITRTGTPMVTVGDQVQAGDVLIKGEQYIYDDSQTLIQTHSVPADGDVEGLRQIHYQKRYDLTYEKKDYSLKSHTGYSLKVGDALLSLPEISPIEGPYDTLTETIQYRLTENFILPVALIKTVKTPYTLTSSTYSQAELKALAEQALEVYLKDLSLQGWQLISQDIQFQLQDEYYQAQGTLHVLGPIGR